MNSTSASYGPDQRHTIATAVDMKGGCLARYGALASLTYSYSATAKGAMFWSRRQDERSGMQSFAQIFGGPNPRQC